MSPLLYLGYMLEPLTRGLMYAMVIAIAVIYQLSAVTLVAMGLFLLRWIVQTAVLNVEKEIGQINISTQYLTVPVSVAIKGANYDKFTLSTESLPAEGGVVTVSFKSDEVGVHEAYIELSSSEAPSVFIPISVLCQNAEGIESVEQSDVNCQKVIRNGMLFIERNGKTYSVLGQ